MAEAVIVEALRTPIARGKKGAGEFSGLHPARLFSKVMDGLRSLASDTSGGSLVLL